MELAVSGHGERVLTLESELAAKQLELAKTQLCVNGFLQHDADQKSLIE
jgi:hypothetical protein